MVFSRELGIRGLFHECKGQVCSFDLKLIWKLGGWQKMQRHFTTVHSTFSQDFPVGSNLWKEKIRELKTQLQQQQSLFTRPVQKATACTEASFKAVHILTKRKKAFTDGSVVKEAMTAVAEMLFKDHKCKTEILSAFSDVQLGANTMRVSALATDAGRQLETDISWCKWFSIQCDEPVDASDAAQLAIFILMVFEDSTVHQEFLTLLSLKTTTRGVDIYNAVKNYFIEQKIPVEKLVSIITDGAPAMSGRHAGFIAQRKADPDFLTFLDYHCIIHQQA